MEVSCEPKRFISNRCMQQHGLLRSCHPVAGSHDAAIQALLCSHSRCCCCCTGLLSGIKSGIKPASSSMLRSASSPLHEEVGVQLIMLLTDALFQKCVLLVRGRLHGIGRHTAYHVFDAAQRHGLFWSRCWKDCSHLHVSCKGLCSRICMAYVSVLVIRILLWQSSLGCSTCVALFNTACCLLLRLSAILAIRMMEQTVVILI